MLVVLALTLMPEGCAKLMGKKPAPSAERDVPPTPVPVSTTPVASATTPPIWHPPEEVAPTTPSTAPPPSADLVKARAAADARDFKKVRALLEKRVRAGKVPLEEAQLLYRACAALRDRPCVDAVKAKHPLVE